MKLTPFLIVFMLISFVTTLYSQVPAAGKVYSHKVVIDSVIQTKAYTYLKVKERIGEKDSLQWVALPVFEAKQGDIYYYDGGMEMGEFHSRELDRTFAQIIFLAAVSTSAEIVEANLLPAVVIDTAPLNLPPPIIHTVVVKEVLQTGGYSYLRVKEGDKEQWLAVVKIPAVVGQTYTYDDAAPVKNFSSAELKRTFDEILFIAKLNLIRNQALQESSKTTKRSGKIKLVSIGDIYKDRQSYAGKTVKIKGKVTKFNSNILDKEWVHIEDGTAYAGRYDLVFTIDQPVTVGDIVTVEGKISIDKDFGSGYRFEVIIEDGKILAN